MELATIGLAVALAAALAALAGLVVRLRSLGRDLQRERGLAAEAAAKLETWLHDKTRAETRLAESERSVADLRSELAHARSARDAAVERTQAAEQQAALRAQQLTEMQKRLDDWETAKAESLQAAKAAVLATASELSTKLLADHKQESEAAKKESEERVRQTTEALLKQVHEVTKTVASLSRQVDDNRDTMDTVWKALSSPGGAGQFAEVGLENTLKSFGLVKGRDFVIQQSLEGRGLRPDAMVLMPGDTVLVVDSKASKFLLDLAEAEGTEQEKEAWQNLARTMNNHLKSLTDKDYRAGIRDSYRDAGRSGELRRVMMVMYLPNEGAVEKLATADPDFARKAARAEVTVAGPSALACLIGFARVEIDLGRQAENHERIIDSTRSLLDSIGFVIEHVQSLGKGIKSAADGYVRLTGSLNTRLLPRVRGLADQGLRPGRQKPIPRQVPAFQVVQLESGDLIEGEATEPADPGQLPDLSGRDNAGPPA
ncbi:MAG: DNA recombination protein RmuC [Rhodospirillales bacterium]|nr:MAG: DNA recombination protein RmuC [Rhodospirillales bacterium]